MTNEWLSEKITYISALKNPNDAQKLLLELAQIQYRTPDQEKKLNALIKAEKAMERATLKNQRQCLTNLRELLSDLQQSGLGSPAIMVVGDVVTGVREALRAPALADQSA